MRTIWNPLAYISDYGWTCIVSVAGLLFAAMVLAGVNVMLKCKPIADRPSDDALEQTYREGLEIYKQSLLAHDFDQCYFMRGILVGVGIAMGYRRGDIIFEMTKDLDSDSEFEAAIHAKEKAPPAAATDEGADE